MNVGKRLCAALIAVVMTAGGTCGAANCTVKKEWSNATDKSTAIVDVTFDGDDTDGISVVAGYEANGALCAVSVKPLEQNTAKHTVDFLNLTELDRGKLFLWNADTLAPLTPAQDSTRAAFADGIKTPLAAANSFTTAYLRRVTFETEDFSVFRSDLYNHNVPDFIKTDEITAHSGDFSLKVCARSNAAQTLGAYITGIDPASDETVAISCYVRNPAGVSTQRYEIQAYYPTESGKEWKACGIPVTATDTGWTLLRGEIDYSDYAFTDTPYVQIITKDGYTGDFYVDDFLIEAQSTPDRYDDLTYTAPVRGNGISDTASAVSAEEKTERENLPVLKNVYGEYFKIGAAVCDNALNPENRYNRIITKHFNSAVSENAFKMQSLVKDPQKKDVYDFSAADGFMDFCAQSGIADIAGHCLVWDLQSVKPYLEDSAGNTLSRDAALAFMKEYINKVIRHFEGDGNENEYLGGVDYSSWHINVWDVVNEAADGYTADGYKTSGGGWINAVGTDYVDYAYAYAAEVCDNGEYDISLRYNDYNEYDENKLTAVYNIVKGLKDDGKRVDTVGIQSHYRANVNVNDVRRAFERLASLGVSIDVTELDVSAYTDEQRNARVQLYESGVAESAEYNQIMLYRDLFELYKEYKDTVGRVNFWTVTDRLSATNGSENGFYRTDYGGIFDRNYIAKPQFWAITDAARFETLYPQYKRKTELVWNFEDNVGEEVSAAYSLDVGKWTGGNNESTNNYRSGMSPTYVKHTDVPFEYISSGENNGCMKISLPARPADYDTSDEGWYIPQGMGIRVRLSKDVLDVGKTYTLSFNMADGYAKTNQNRVYAKLRRPDDPRNINGGGGTVSKLPWLNDDGSDAIGQTAVGWHSYTAELTPAESDFDESGYTVLWIVLRPYNAKSNGTYNQMLPGKDVFYFDDISLSEKQ